jgi:DNA-binding transcriptional MerR regulator
MGFGNDYFIVRDVAKRCKVASSTVRYYTKIGLISPCGKTESGYKLYDKQAIEKIEFIKKAKKLGFTLDEIKVVIDTAESGRAPCKHVISFLKMKKERIEKRMEFLKEFKKRIEKVLRRWEGKLGRCGGKICAIVEEIEIAQD